MALLEYKSEEEKETRLIEVLTNALPILDRYNDQLEIFIEKNDIEFLLTGYFPFYFFEGLNKRMIA